MKKIAKLSEKNKRCPRLLAASYLLSHPTALSAIAFLPNESTISKISII